MTTFDLSPLYRTAIGFDRLADMLTSASRVDSNGYPPYNIKSLGEDRYRITMAVAGFGSDELDIVSEQNTLTIPGSKSDSTKSEKGEHELVYRGIADRSVERRYQLADHVRVVGADLENGLQDIELQRELPERMKPRKAEVGGGQRVSEEKGSKTAAA